MLTRRMLILCVAGVLRAQQFYPDDPLDREPPPIPVTKIASRKLSDYYDFFSNQFHEVGQKQPKHGEPVRAMAVNTLGEPMDGAWYTKRHYYHRMTREELQRGPGGVTPPSMKGKWTVVGAKSEGITPGFQIVDAEQRTYFVKFDPPSNPELATAADSIGARFFHALGYYVPDNYIVHFQRDQLVLGEGVQIADDLGKKHAMTARELDIILDKVAVDGEGSYRATASRAVEGKPIGPPRYYGVRSDDPNDVVPHEHRRDLRGLQVFCAWLDHDDSRAINNLDAIVNVDGVSAVRHYLLDFGSTLGSASDGSNSPRSGAYLFSLRDSAVQLFTLGLKPQSWALASYPDYPAVGRFEWKRFDPGKWVPEYPNRAFENRLPDDEFWAAKQVMAFSDDDIDAIVETGQLSDPAAAAYLARCLRERRDKIGRLYFGKVLPFDRFRMSEGRLVWDDLGAIHGMSPVDDASVTWSEPEGEYAAATISSAKRKGQTVKVYARRNGAEASVVGVERTW